ncbi:MAG: hypothetical protein QXG38_00140, partial [Candidatus Hadarchaeales archaeon]
AGNAEETGFLFLSCVKKERRVRKWHMEDMAGQGDSGPARCTKLFVPTAVPSAKSPSSLQRVGQSTVGTAGRREEVRGGHKVWAISQT